MELDGSQWQFIYQSTGVQHHLTSLSRETENKMSSDIQPALRSSMHSPTGSLKVMTTIDALQSHIMT
jgi:hypothetical protein